ncbi:MAG: peroxide stress protein YaaA [Pseudohongiellaceae bacterium]|jgi:hypothetical protein
MLIVLSPAKTLDFDTPAPLRKHTQPQLLEQARVLNGLLREQDAAALGRLMRISPDLAQLNVERNRHWAPPFTPESAKQAVFAFRGDVYGGLDADSLPASDLAWAQQHLRILSGLYGLLRPLDLIQAYRLEMGTKLANPHGKDLYAFWGDSITRALNEALRAQGDGVLVNLASEEYFGAVRPARLEGRVVTPVFKEYRGGSYRIISLFAKRARGRMASWIIRERLQDPLSLQQFDADGYRFNAALSAGTTLVFTRRQD